MKRMRIFFLSTALSDEIFNEIAARCKRFKPTFSGVGFDRNVAVGLSRLTDVTGVSLYPLPSYPKYPSVWKEEQEYCIENFSCVVPPMLNLPIVKEYIYCRRAIRYIKKQLKRDETAVIVTCGLYRSLLRPAGKLKKKYGIPVCSIVPDLPELMITYRKDFSKLRQLLNKWDVEKARKFRECSDGFVFLSQYMEPQVNKQKKPYIVVDGLCSLPVVQDREIQEEQYVLYAGKITEKFGVRQLIEGFQSADIPGLKLYLCGDGDYADSVREIAQHDDRVQYLGLVSHEKVLELEMNAALLVDPRPTDNEIVKMSFPSKILEYMASGTPVLTTNLPCFAPEYALYQYRIQQETAEGIRDALQTVFSKSEQERTALGQAAKRFILENKTLDKQCEKIFSLLNEVVEKQ